MAYIIFRLEHPKILDSKGEALHKLFRLKSPLDNSPVHFFWGKFREAYYCFFDEVTLVWRL